MAQRLNRLIELEDILLTDQKDLYFKRFPTCCHVQLVTYADGSRGSKCPYGAFGDEAGAVMPISWSSCKTCTHYEFKNK